MTFSDIGCVMRDIQEKMVCLCVLDMRVTYELDVCVLVCKHKISKK